MLIRRLTLTAFAALFAVVSSFALVANAATHAAPALADQDDHYRNQDHRYYGGDRNWNNNRNNGNNDWNRGRNYNNNDWNRGRNYNNGDWNRGRNYNNGDWNRGRRNDRDDRPHDRDHR